jgi:hypothetical protein
LTGRRLDVRGSRDPLLGSGLFSHADGVFVGDDSGAESICVSLGEFGPEEGAEVRTYDITRDHQTGERDRLTRQIAEDENAIQASPYDDPHVIAGNGVAPWRSCATFNARGAPFPSSFVRSAAGG